MFDLKTRIAQWHKSLVHREGISAGNADELLDHLRESIASLITAGLTEEEAFLIATGRIGQPKELAGELAKSDGGILSGMRGGPYTLLIGLVSGIALIFASVGVMWIGSQFDHTGLNAQANPILPGTAYKLPFHPTDLDGIAPHPSWTDALVFSTRWLQGRAYATQMLPGIFWMFVIPILLASAYRLGLAHALRSAARRYVIYGTLSMVLAALLVYRAAFYIPLPPVNQYTLQQTANASVLLRH